MKSFIEIWTEEINKIRNQIVGWSMGVNNQDVGSGWYQQNKTRIWTLLMFVGMMGLFYGVGLITLSRICLIVVILQVLSFVWGFLKG